MRILIHKTCSLFCSPLPRRYEWFISNHWAQEIIYLSCQRPFPVVIEVLLMELFDQRFVRMINNSSFNLQYHTGKLVSIEGSLWEEESACCVISLRWMAPTCVHVRGPITVWGDERASVNMKWVVWGDNNRVNPGKGLDQTGLNHINQSVCVYAHNIWSTVDIHIHNVCVRCEQWTTFSTGTFIQKLLLVMIEHTRFFVVFLVVTSFDSDQPPPPWSFSNLCWWLSLSRAFKAYWGLCTEAYNDPSYHVDARAEPFTPHK